jgi:putative membrane protein
MRRGQPFGTIFSGFAIEPRRPYGATYNSPMIKQYSDHAANERTYLAWLRTGIAIIAFGFVLHTIVKTLGAEPVHHISDGGREAGLALVLVGLITLVVATWRFTVTSRKISSEQIISFDPRSAKRLGILIIVLGIFVLAYMTRLLSSAQ